jgi:hypothetical protein
MRMPQLPAFERLTGELKLNGEQAKALFQTIQEGFDGCAALRDETDATTIREELAKLDNALAQLAQLSASNNIRKAFKAMPPMSTLGFLMSPSAALKVPGYREHPLVGPELNRLIEQDPHHKPILPSDFDNLALQHRQVELSKLASDALEYLLTSLREPIQQFLRQTAEKGGNRPRSDRDLIVLLLARDAPSIIGCEPSTSNPFLNLCNQVTAACGISEDGLEVAIKKCLKNQKHWLQWYRLPAFSSPSAATEKEMDNGAEKNSK